LIIKFLFQIYPFIVDILSVQWQNEGSIGCKAVACVLGQPKVPECVSAFSSISFSSCSKKIIVISVVVSFLRLACNGWRYG